MINFKRKNRNISGAIVYRGTWDANANTPTLTDNGGGGNKGDYYVVSVSGTTTIDTISSWNIGDWIINNGVVWQIADHTDVVTSVFGRLGAVTAQTNDYTFAEIDKTTSNIADITTRSHTSLTDIGTKLHSEIDTHIATVIGNPHSVTKTEVSLGNVTDDAQVKKRATSTSGNIPAWDGTTGDALTDGYPVETTLAGAATKLARADAIKTYVDSLLSTNDAMVLKGGIDCSGNPNYPAADAGHTYKITVNGKIGGASGSNVTVGDTIYCTVDSTSAGDQATVGANWTVIQNNLEDATIAIKGYVELATDAETKARADTTRAVTPVSLSDFPVTDDSIAVDNSIVREDGTTGKKVQKSLSSIDDNGSINIPTGQKYKINSVNLAPGDIGAAPSTEGVTNGNSHDHDGGDGGQIDHTKLSTIGTKTHATIDTEVNANKITSIEAIIDGQNFAITTGLKGFIVIPYACTIQGVRLLSDISTTTVIDLWVDSYANYPPTVADTITASAKPTLTTAIKVEDTTLTGWTKLLAKGSIIAFNVDSNNNSKQLNIYIDVLK